MGGAFLWVIGLWLKTGRDLSVERIAQESLFTFVARKNGVLYGGYFNRVLLIGS